MDNPAFVDYYELMQISPNAEPETVQRVYRMLAARYHPDNPHTGDTDRFLLLEEAYRVLSDRADRAAYDAAYQARRIVPLGVFNLREFAIGMSGEQNRRMGILCLLYKQRRANPDSPGLSLLDLERLMSFPREHLEFTIWYLKDRGLIRQSENSDLAVTGDGTDYVESHLPHHKVLGKLLQAAGEPDAAADYPEEVVNP